MKKTFRVVSLLGVFLFAGCATTSHRREPPTREPHRVTLTLVGDVLPFHWPIEMVYKSVRRSGGERAVQDYPFEKVKPFLEGIVFGNLEGPLTEEGTRTFPDKDERSYFQIPVSYAETLKRAGFDVLGLANNHIRDCGDPGVLETIRTVRRAGMLPVGAGKDMTEARQPVYLRENGLTVAFLCYSRVKPKSVWATKDQVGAAWGDEGVVVEDIRAARGKADVVVVSFHWGREYFSDWSVRRVESERVRLARAAVDAGAALVVGQHSHTVEPLETYGRGLIAYGLGNFVFGASTQEGHPESVILQVEVDSTGVVSHRVIPVLISPKNARYQPVPLSGSKRKRFLQRLEGINKSHAASILKPEKKLSK